VILAGAVAPGTFAYVDRDWLPAASGAVPSLTVSADGTLAWGEDSAVKPRGAADPDTAAALVLLSVARDAAAAVADLPAGSIEVIGSGLIAHLVRVLVGDVPARTAEHPRAVVDVTGDPAVILDATRRVADLGTVVLVGEALGRRAEMNLYADVHVRGLTLVGVAPPLQQPESSAVLADDGPLIARCHESLGRVSSGIVAPAGSAWYAVAA
jgi:hypothetical protein